MSTYVYLFRNGPRPATAANMQQQMQDWSVWMKELRALNCLKDAGQPVAPEGKVVKGLRRDVANGPVLDGGQVVSGFLVIEARDIDQAVELSRGCPIFSSDGSVEIRPVMTLSS